MAPLSSRSTTGHLVVAMSYLLLSAAPALSNELVADDRKIATAAGEWEVRLLTDGTIMHAGPRTSAVIDFTKDRRSIRLTRGEAMFHVARQPERPFVVETKFATAYASGTAFAVSHEPSNRVRVVVQNGTVEVSRVITSHAARTKLKDSYPRLTLKAGEQTIVAKTGPLLAEQVNAENSLAWTERRLIFDHQTVEQAVREFNRRNRRQIKLLFPAIAQRPVRGVFGASDPELFTVFLEREGMAEVMESWSGTLLLVAPKKNGSAASTHAPGAP